MGDVISIKSKSHPARGRESLDYPIEGEGDEGRFLISRAENFGSRTPPVYSHSSHT